MLNLRRRVVVLLGPALALTVVACGGDDDDDAAPANTDAARADTVAASLPGTTWVLATASALDGTELPAIGTATLEFDADGTSLAGSTGCNRITGSYAQSGSDLTITLGPVTLAACAEPGLAEQEAAILAYLPEVASYEVDLQLTLTDSNDATVLTYDPGVSTLEGTSWTATGVNNGRDAVVSSAATESVTAAFDADGLVSGFAGCNTYTAGYETAGDDAISISEVATTRMACADDAMELEQQFVAALQNATAYSIAGDTLTLRDAGGSTQATFTSAT